MEYPTPISIPDRNKMFCINCKNCKIDTNKDQIGICKKDGKSVLLKNEFCNYFTAKAVRKTA